MFPRIAIVDDNTLQAMGLKSVLTEIIPVAEVVVFASCADMRCDEGEMFSHYFVSSKVLLASSEFFLKWQQRTIVLVSQQVPGQLFARFKTLNICQPEHLLVKSVLRLYQMGHGGKGGHAHVSQAIAGDAPVADISQREAEVLSLVVKGLINKEIADKLNISLTTVVTHRKNITEKLHLKSVSALTVYAVMHGIVSVDEI
ncbi:MAG: helix-turn-helix transcriptional regulator [Bacteroides sp.]|nr:helix-turn-helix transcriptional regulator [Roseburia sp.]MCM1346934.1 helix-turn-helix transcriptional regulator [Bacteroides sp.]MCM1421500.1 helix-turn-helix transcriptional regulator [Bacteroides sp.]